MLSKSVLDITEGSSWNLKTEHEKSLHLIHKEVEVGGWKQELTPNIYRAT